MISIPCFFHLSGSVKCSWSNNILYTKINKKSGSVNISILVSCDNIWRTQFSLVNNIVGKEEICVGADAITVEVLSEEKICHCLQRDISLCFHTSTYIHQFGDITTTRKKAWGFWTWCRHATIATISWFSYLSFFGYSRQNSVLCISEWILFVFLSQR